MQGGEGVNQRRWLLAAALLAVLIVVGTIAIIVVSAMGQGSTGLPQISDPAAFAVLALLGALVLVVVAVDARGRLAEYRATLLDTYMFLPGLGAVLATGFYLGTIGSARAAFWQDNALLLGSGLAALAWLLYPMLDRTYSHSDVARPGSYGELTARLDAVDAILTKIPDAPPECPQLAATGAAARAEATAEVATIRAQLLVPGLPWVTGDGYVDAWSRIHHAEEALIECQPTSTVLQGALYDVLRLRGSQIADSQELTSKLRAAMVEIDPGSDHYMADLGIWPLTGWRPDRPAPLAGPTDAGGPSDATAGGGTGTVAGSNPGAQPVAQPATPGSGQPAAPGSAQPAAPGSAQLPATQPAGSGSAQPTPQPAAPQAGGIVGGLLGRVGSIAARTGGLAATVVRTAEGALSGVGGPAGTSTGKVPNGGQGAPPPAASGVGAAPGHSPAAPGSGTSATSLVHGTPAVPPGPSGASISGPSASPGAPVAPPLPGQSAVAIPGPSGASISGPSASPGAPVAPPLPGQSAVAIPGPSGASIPGPSPTPGAPVAPPLPGQSAVAIPGPSATPGAPGAPAAAAPASTGGSTGLPVPPATPAPIDSPADAASRIATGSSDDCAHLARGRAVVRTVRHTINEYRDDLWENLIRARARLIRTTFAAGVVAYTVLALALVQRVSPSLVVGAWAIFLAGATVGLFRQLSDAASDENAQEDYGLSAARVYQTPLLSGIAAVLGVVLTTGVQLTTLAASGTATLPLQDVFDLTKNPTALLLAFIFGFSPSLVMSRISQKEADVKAGLNTSESTARK